MCSDKLTEPRADCPSADEIAVLLALLSVEEVREEAGLPPVGAPLTCEQIAAWCGCSPSMIRDMEFAARRKMIGAMRRSGIYEELKNRHHEQD